MNKKIELNKLINSIFKLINEAKFDISKVDNTNILENEQIISDPKYIKTSYKDISKKKSSQERKEGIDDWSSLKFISSSNIKSLNTKVRDHDLSNIDLEKKIRDIFIDSLETWQKKNLKKLLDNIYQDLVKENLKNKLK